MTQADAQETTIEVRFAATKSLWFDMIFVAGNQGRIVEVADTVWDFQELRDWLRAIIHGLPALMHCDREGYIDEVTTTPLDETRVHLTIRNWNGGEIYLNAIVGRRKLVWEVYWELANLDRIWGHEPSPSRKDWWRLPEVEKWLDWEKHGQSLEFHDPVGKRTRPGDP